MTSPPQPFPLPAPQLSLCPHCVFSAAFRAKGGDASYEYDHSANLVALQGPAAASVLPRLLSPADAAALPRMPFMTGRPMPVLGVQGCIVTRCGYTGEDGFEIAMPAHAAEKITRALLDHPEVRRCALPWQCSAGRAVFPLALLACSRLPACLLVWCLSVCLSVCLSPIGA